MQPSQPESPFENSFNHHIGESPANNNNTEQSRWQERQSHNTHQMELLSTIESFVSSQPKPATKPSTKKKTFLRKGGGTINQRNKYQMEQQRQAERKRQKKLGLTPVKPKTQKIILMEQWREKQKKKDKQIREHKKTSMNLNNMKLLKQKKSQKSLASVPISLDDELETSSLFEHPIHVDDLPSSTPSHPSKQPVEQVEHKTVEQDIAPETTEQNEEKEPVGLWTQPVPVAATFPKKAKFNFARQAVGDRNKRASYPAYSHHHHTNLYGKNRKKEEGQQYSQYKNMYHKQATVNTVSKRDRLAAKYQDRKANSMGVQAEKAMAMKMEELELSIAKYEEKAQEAEVMKQSSLEQFRKYQSLTQDKAQDLEHKQREFEKYKKKQERILCQKTQELDKRSRALSNIPDRKQRKHIQEMKQQLVELKAQFTQKEKRFKSKIERLSKQNKQLQLQKQELQTEMAEFQKQRLQIWKNDEKKTAKNVKHNLSRSMTATQPIMQANQVAEARPQTAAYARYVVTRHAGREMQNNGVDDEEDDVSTCSSSEDSSASHASTNNGEMMKKKTQKVENLENVPLVANSQNLAKIPNLAAVPDEFEPAHMSVAQMRSACVLHRSKPLDRMQHPDGKIEQIYSDGSKLILFPNGTEKYVFGNLQMNSAEPRKYVKQLYVKLHNGDVHKVLEDGTEVYFYSKHDIIHATKTDGIQLYYFSAQHEIHFPDGTKHVLFADGTKKYMYPNGDEQCVFPPNDA